MTDPCWPDFLDRFDTDRERALMEFYKFLVWTLNKVPPRPMRSLNKEDKEDRIHDIYIHCVKHNFRVLRRYKNTGKPFAAWLYTVAHNVVMDYIKKKGLEPQLVSIDANRDFKELINILPDYSSDSSKKLHWVDLLRIVRELMTKLDKCCQLLLQMAADEYTIREMVKILGKPPDQNKKISDALRYCREKLKKKLKERGIDYLFRSG